MKTLIATFGVALLAVTHAWAYREDIHPEFHSGLSINSVPSTDRDHWMRLANSAIYYPPVSHPCPQAPFGTVVVNTTSNELICAIANRVGSTGDPTQHGEITAIQHCTNVLQKKGLSPQEILAAWKHFSLYTNAEPCTMCLSAIRWAGFKEVIYGTSVRTIAESKLTSPAEDRDSIDLLVDVSSSDFLPQMVVIRSIFLPIWCSKKATRSVTLR